MPNCRTCSPWCRRCHKKADYKFPVECPHCGWYNPYERETCKKCGAPVVHDEQKAVDHLNAEVKKACFFCSPFERPLCNECVETGRTKVCPECGSACWGRARPARSAGMPSERSSRRGVRAAPALCFQGASGVLQLAVQRGLADFQQGRCVGYVPSGLTHGLFHGDAFQPLERERGQRGGFAGRRTAMPALRCGGFGGKTAVRHLDS